MDDQSPIMPELEYEISRKTLKRIHAALLIIVALTAWNFVL
jgi:hypothetical protein